MPLSQDTLASLAAAAKLREAEAHAEEAEAERENLAIKAARLAAYERHATACAQLTALIPVANAERATLGLPPLTVGVWEPLPLGEVTEITPEHHEGRDTE